MEKKEDKMIRRTKDAFLLFGVGIILLLSLYPLSDLCAQQKAIPTKTLRIGCINALSGKGAGIGIPFNNVLIMQMEEYNKAGGINVGGEKYRIELIIEDSKYTAEGARIAVEKLIYRDKVKFLLGPSISSEVLAVSTIAEREKILRLTDGITPKIVGPQNKYGFRPYLTSTERKPVMYKWIKDNLTNVKRIGCSGSDDETGHANAKAIKKCAEAYGLEFCEPVFFPRGTADFFPLMTRLLNMKPDYIDYGGNPLGEVALQVKAASQLGFKGYMSLDYPQNLSEFCAIAGKENAEGFLFFDTLIAEDRPSTKILMEAYIARWNDWDPYALKWGVFLPILIESIKKAGTVEDTTKVRDTMEKMEFDTPMGHVRWSGAKTYGIAHQMYTPFGIAKVQNGKLVGVTVIPPEKLIEVLGEK
jgi:branched-chain amino acid transport system substrate-binding protein